MRTAIYVLYDREGRFVNNYSTEGLAVAYATGKWFLDEETGKPSYSVRTYTLTHVLKVNKGRQTRKTV